MVEREEDENEDFAAMLEESLQPRRFRSGETVEGTIVAFGTDVAFVDVGGKGEATIDLEEMKGEDGEVEARVGGTIKAVVVSTSGGIKLSWTLARHAATREALVEAHESGLPVEGRVESAIKGGFEVRFSGQRAFCPISQIDTRYTEDPEEHVGKTYRFRVIECKDGGKNVVVSRRAILEDEEAARAAEVRKLVVEGAVLRGRVVSVVDYGAFVDLGGGVQGLLHVSEMGWARVTNPSEVVQLGDEIEVKVLRVDEERGKISLGLKQLQANPWSSVATTFQTGQLVKGVVRRLTDFGAFVELAPGIDGLVPRAESGVERDGDLRKAFPVGSEIEVIVLDVDADGRRIRLSRNAVSEAHERGEARDYAERQEKEQDGRGGFGSFADSLRAAIERPKK